MANKERLYLKYRPKDLDEVVGQKHIVATLKKASKNDKFVHSYLLAGNRGCGKTTCARIVANLMNCENPVDGKLCGKCLACLTIPKKMSMDVIEPDGATNRGIDKIRALKDSANFFPSQLKYKIYIIDECHMLTTEAWNALLAIVEEPPPYLKFIFCTTEPRKVIDTIASRCQRFNFGKIPTQDMVKRLKYIAENENIEIEDDALFLLSKISRGILRDAIVKLEQIATVADGKKVVEKHIQSFLGPQIGRVSLTL
jgi:DNA polymerase-3 subunit gamma/tau